MINDDRYYGHGRLFFSAFTILRCHARACHHEVALEAHHASGGHLLRRTCPKGCRKKYDRVMGKGLGRPSIRLRHRHIRLPPRWDRTCPRCHGTDGWDYIRTEVHLSTPVHTYR